MATGNIILPIHSAKIAGSYITAGAQIEGGAGPWKLLFDASTKESAIWQFRLPDNYASAPSLVLHFSMASATANKVVLDGEVYAITPGDSQDVDSASFDSSNQDGTGVTVPGTAGYVGTITFNLTNFDSGAAGDLILLRVNRLVADANDTATGDLELLAVTFKYTTT